MVAAPLVAIGVMHPDGQHEFLGKADQGLMLLLNVFLRPAMMVIGFIAGISLSYVGVWLLNMGFGRAMSLSKDVSSALAVIWLAPAMAVIYAATAVAVISKAFSLIHILPDKVLRWISGGITESLGSEAAGEAGKIKGAATSAGQQMGGAMAKGTEAGISGAAKQHDQNLKESQSQDSGPDSEVGGGGGGGGGGLSDAGGGGGAAGGGAGGVPIA